MEGPDGADRCEPFAETTPQGRRPPPQIVGCAVWDNWWPSLVLIVYVLVPMPHLFFEATLLRASLSLSRSLSLSPSRFLPLHLALSLIPISLSLFLTLSLTLSLSLSREEDIVKEKVLSLCE